MNNYQWWTCIALSVGWALMGNWEIANTFIVGSLVISALDK